MRRDHPPVQAVLQSLRSGLPRRGYREDSLEEDPPGHHTRHLSVVARRFPVLIQGMEGALRARALARRLDHRTVGFRARRKPEILKRLRAEAIRVNKEYAKRFGIAESTCITCVKPSGTLSQTVDCSSGMHPRHSKYYIRRIRISATDSLFKMLKDQGVPYHPEIGQNPENATTFVLEFPVKAPRRLDLQERCHSAGTARALEDGQDRTTPSTIRR